MNFHDMLGLWAIRPEVGESLVQNFARFLETATPEQLAAATARQAPQGGGQPLPYEVRNGVAVISIQGTLSKQPMYDWWSGKQIGTTYGQIVSAHEDAQKDPSVRAIVGAWDTPGGTVDGAQEAANSLFEMRASGKPMEAVAVGQMCSAGEMCGSAVGPVWASSDTTDMGSIGVLAMHRDWSGFESRLGIKTTLLTAGKYKGVGWGPLSDSDKAILQEGLDHSYQVFKQTVARNRGISMDAVEAMAEGRVFKGQKAVQVGLASGVATVANRMAALSKTAVAVSNRGAAVALAEPNNPKQEKKRMDKETILKEHPELAEAFREEGRAEGRKVGAEAERKRIDGVMALGLKVKGCDAVIREMAFDGQTTPEQASMKILDVVAERKGEIAAKIVREAAKPVAASHADGDNGGRPELTGAEWGVKIKATIAEHAARGITLTPQAAKAIILQKGA